MNILGMRSFTLAVVPIFLTIFMPVGLRVKAQEIASDSSGEVVQSNKRSKIYFNITGTSGVVLPFFPGYSLESSASALEEAERDALYKRDTAALKLLWATDFSIENFKGNKVMSETFSSSGLPYYAVFIRVVETVTLVDGLLYVHGVDHTSLIDVNKSSVQPMPHKFTHVWKMFGSSWKMILKFPSDF